MLVYSWLAPQREALAQDESKAIRGLGGPGSRAPFRPDRGLLWRASDGRVGGWGGNKDRMKKGEKSPRGNLPHCGKKPNNTMLLLNSTGDSRCHNHSLTL